MACFSAANASPAASVTAVASPAWVQRSDSKTELGRDDEIIFGDRVSTGDGGLIEIRLWSGVDLRVYSGTEASFGAPLETEASDSPPVLLLHRGRICLESPPASSTGHNFSLNLADRLLAAIHQYGHICASRRQGLSTVDLRAGSVQITNVIDPGIVILSQAGIEFRMGDEGSYQLLPLAEDAEIADMKQQPFIVETKVEKEAPAPETDKLARELVIIEEPETNELQVEPVTDASGYIYTVYLFSSRSEEAASQVNEKFQRAGHETRILVNQKEDPVRYRIAVSGFNSRQSAQEFADSITGKLGIRDTWIGKDRPVQ
jgi:hypothetical protein